MRGSQRSSLTYIYYKLVRKEDNEFLPRPLFKGGTKKDNYKGYPDESSLVGNLTQLKFEDYKDSTGKPRQSIKVVLEDTQTEEAYSITLGWTQLSRDMLNSLLNIKKLGKIGLSLYTNKEGFHAIGVYNDEDWAGFKYKYEEYKDKITVARLDSGDVRQFGEVNKMFKKDIEETFLPMLSKKEDDSVLPESELKGEDYRKKDEVKEQPPVIEEPPPSGADDLSF